WRASGYTIMALTPAADALDLRGIREVPMRLAVLVGAEGDGLRRETLVGADLRVRIAMAPGFDSLNVATAAGVALFVVSGAAKQ
ncbi:MAG: TrmH family RNA methyltransferase, partial [Myxococcales bacterium]